MITDWIRKLNREEDIIQRASSSQCLPDNRIDIRIANSLEQAPFHFVRSLCSAINYHRTSVWRHLNSTGDRIRNLHIFPHTLSPAHKVQMIRKVIELKSAEISQTAQLALSLEER
jgi:hypothetical protein